MSFHYNHNKFHKPAYYLAIFFLFLLWIPFRRVDAHVLQQDKNIQGILHIDPEDDPIIGQQATLSIELKDDTHIFNLKDCNCNITISSEGVTLLSKSIEDSEVKTTDTSILFSYIFPKKQIYTISLVGRPLPGKQFNTFTLTYVQRVERENIAEHTPGAGAHAGHLIQIHLAHIVIFGGGILACLYVIGRDIWDRKRYNRKV